LWKSIPGWNGPRKKRILKCVNRRLETLELSAVTSCSSVDVVQDGTPVELQPVHL